MVVWALAGRRASADGGFAERVGYVGHLRAGVVVVMPRGPADRVDDGRVRVFISYAHDSAEHQDSVRDFWVFLRATGFDARLDLPAANRPRSGDRTGRCGSTDSCGMPISC